MILDSILLCCCSRAKPKLAENPYPIPMNSESNDIYSITNREPTFPTEPPEDIACLSIHQNPPIVRRTSLPDTFVKDSLEFRHVQPGPSLSSPNLYEVPNSRKFAKSRHDSDGLDTMELQSRTANNVLGAVDTAEKTSTDEFFDCYDSNLEREKGNEKDSKEDKQEFGVPNIVITNVTDEENSQSEAFSPNRPAEPLPNRSQKSPTGDPYAVTLYPFQGSQFDELTCETGDKILLKREVDDQWIYGMNMRTGQHGIVPLGYLEVRIPLAPTSSAPQIHSFPPNVTCALYDYLTGVDGDLQFRTGDRITVLEYVNDDWLRGEIAGKTGIFPSNYVDTSSLSLSPPTQSVRSSSAHQTTSETATVAFDYNSEVADDLICRAGDVIIVVEHVNSDWIRGRLNGREGLVPTTYLQMPSTTTVKTMNVEMTAISDYSSTEPGHLEVSRGDKVTVVEEVDAHWYKAKLSGRAFRFVPPAFVPKNVLQ